MERSLLGAGDLPTKMDGTTLALIDLCRQAPRRAVDSSASPLTTNSAHGQLFSPPAAVNGETQAACFP